MKRLDIQTANKMGHLRGRKGSTTGLQCDLCHHKQNWAEKSLRPDLDLNEQMWATHTHIPLPTRTHIQTCIPHPTCTHFLPLYGWIYI